nr:ADP-ribosylglycohydrolase family protein [Sphaerochaetaceae bacterium]
DGIMGAESTAVQIFLAREGKSLEELMKYEIENYYYIGITLDELRKFYKWVSICDGTCQAAFLSLYEAKDFEDAIRNSISLGGDSDTIAAICGGIAEAVFGIPDNIKDKGLSYLDEYLKGIYDAFNERFIKR